ncbi:hypothetical protein Tco_1101530 [Tanacetum coccineum]
MPRTLGTHDNEAGSSRSNSPRQHETVEEAAKSRYNTKLAQFLPSLIYSPCVVDWNMLNQMACGEEIDEMLTIKFELCQGFYSTYEFDEVCADDELRTKKVIKFRLCGRAFSWTLLEFAASREENLSLSRSHAFTIRKLVLRVLHKMITYGLCQRTTGYDKMQKNDLWLLSMFEARHQNGYTNIAKRKNLLSEEVLNSLSASIYYKALDTTTLKELIDSKGRLIPEVPELGVLRVAIPKPPRASMQDLYERIDSMEIRQRAIERIVPLWEAYNPPGYDQQQYDQYYQQYYQQQHSGDDDE